MKWYNFNQNNSGGVFVIDANLDVDVHIQASGESDARAKAAEIGVYFNGCRDGRDCPCCGDRWSDYGMDEPTDVPSKYGEPLFNDLPFDRESRGHVLHYADGRILRSYENEFGQPVATLADLIVDVPLNQPKELTS